MKTSIKQKIISDISKTLFAFNPEYINKFLCPICFKTFDVSDHNNLTIAHILPKAADGNISTWTCKKCNNDIGSNADKWLGKYIQTIKTKEVFGYDNGIKSFTLDGINIQGKILQRNGAINLFVDKRRNSKIQLDKFQDNILLEKRNRTLQVSLPILDKKDLIDIGFINAAYLYGFSIFGYSWIMQDHFDSIRTAIEKREPMYSNNVFITNIISDIDKREHYFGFAVINGIYVPYIKLKAKCIFFAPYYNQNALDPLRTMQNNYNLEIKRLSSIPNHTYTKPFLMTIGNNVIIYPNKGKNKMPISFVIFIHENDFRIDILDSIVDSSYKEEYIKTGKPLKIISFKLK